MNDGGPAFPTANHICQTDTSIHAAGDVIGNGGMSLRDWFAGIALNGDLSAETQDYQTRGSSEGATREQLLAMNAYKIADAMLAERERTNER